MTVRNFFCSEGNVGKTPTLSYVPVGDDQKPVIEFDCRFSYDKRDNKTGHHADVGGFWATVVFWGKRAVKANELIKSGARVLVVGEMSQEAFIATKGEREGQELTKMIINASHVALSLLSIETVEFTKKSGANNRNQQAGGADQQQATLDGGPSDDELNYLNQQ